MVDRYVTIKDFTTSDHHAVLVTFKPDAGCWNAGQHKPIVQCETLDLTELEDLAPEFQGRLSPLLKECQDLAEVEDALWTIGVEVLGLQKQRSGRRPFLNHKVLLLKKAVCSLRQLLQAYARHSSQATLQCLWNQTQT